MINHFVIVVVTEIFLSLRNISASYNWWHLMFYAAAAKSRQSCPTLCDPIDCSPPGSTVPGILQARTLEWVAIFFSSGWKWKVKWSRSVVSNSLRPHGLQPSRLLHPWDFPSKSTGVGCHCLLCTFCYVWKQNTPHINRFYFLVVNISVFLIF